MGFSISNRARAMALLRSRIYDAKRQKLDAERAADRKAQVGSGDRSERIRTYNFPQGRLTDHRINLTLYKLDKADIADCDVYFSSMATAEECAVFKAAGKDAAARILEACKTRQASQLTAYENYVPTEVAKINAAIITQAGDYVFYIVSNDQAKVSSVLSGCGVTVSAAK